MAMDIELKRIPEPEAISEARHALDWLAHLLPSEKLEDVRLVVSELVTNSPLHAGLSHDD
jgi:anti-sigma regulatory factor (Ser/Thr protein kinase)